MEDFVGIKAPETQPFDEQRFTECVMAMIAISLDTLRAWADAFKYQGYDPKVTEGELRRLQKEKKISDAQFNMDMAALIIWYIYRGSRLTGKAENRTDAEVLKVISKLKARYEIKDSNGNTKPNYKLTDITLARIAGVFPHAVGNYLQKGLGRILGTKPANLPRAYAWPGGAALIPKTNQPMFDLWMQWSKSFDALIKPKTPTEETSLNQYGQATWNSPIVLATDRGAYSRTFTNMAS
jgi:hypothetical protein